MTVAELIEILKTMPQNYPVEVNDNDGGRLFDIDEVICFTEEDMDPDYPEDRPGVVIEVNVE